MGNGMNKVLPGLYVGNYRDSKDHQQLEKFQITHIVAIHDSPRRLLPDKHYLCVMASDTPDQNLSQYFSVCNDFIHAARLREGNVLIHCLAGMSRSVTVAVAYIMTATNLNWREALKVVRAGRAVANPNAGFQNQLQEFETYRLVEERKRLRERFPSSALEQLDRTKCMTALDNYQELLQNKDICEGNCTRGEKCPTGVCNIEPAKGLFRRRPSVASTRSRLCAQPSSSYGNTRATVIGGSCPTSPKRTPLPQRIPEDEESLKPTTSLEAAQYAAAIEDARRELQEKRKEKPLIENSGSVAKKNCIDNCNTEKKAIYKEIDSKFVSSDGANLQLQHSASTISGSVVRPRSSPGGLYAYTNSVQSSVHGSRIDLKDCDKGSAIYLGCSAPRTSSLSLSSRGSSSGSAPPSPSNTPPVSPRHGTKRSISKLKKQR